MILLMSPTIDFTAYYIRSNSAGSLRTTSELRVEYVSTVDSTRLVSVPAFMFEVIGDKERNV